MNKRLNINLITFFMLASIGNAIAIEPQLIHESVVYEFEGDFESTSEDLKEVITSRGMVISYVSHAKTMLDRTAEVVGITESAYPSGAEIILFCKADTSHKLVQTNPHHITLCPYAISVYDIQNSKDKVFLSYRKAPEGIAEYVAIENLLKDIIEEVIEQ